MPKKLLSIFGEKGQGKSTLSNPLLCGCDHVRYFKDNEGEEPLPCKTSDECCACTELIAEYELGEITIADTPGIDDTRDAEHFCDLLQRAREDAVIAGIMVLQSGRGSTTFEQVLEYVKKLLGVKLVG